MTSRARWTRAAFWACLLTSTAARADVQATHELTDAELLDLAEQETIEIFAERPDKPFDRDTEVRLTGEQLAARGAVDLATALALLPDVNVREAGRGGFNIDIRGARRGAVSIFIDGVLVSDPFYGTFDVATIPITDIVQIRVSTTPQSPIDGPGGPGGVIEVHTRDAIGPQQVIARVTGDSLPSFGVSGTARAALARHLALRIAASGLAGARDLELPRDASISEGRRAATGSARLEYRKRDRRIALDGFLDDRSYIAPPSTEGAVALILLVDRETTARATVRADDRIGSLQLQGQSWVHTLDRRSRRFRDAQLQNQITFEDLSATRAGGMALATTPIAKDFRVAASATVNHETARVVGSTGDTSQGELTMTGLAVDGQYERGRVRVDLAGGLAVPVGVAGADPWPEAKLVTKLRPHQELEITATAGYKGRVPTLRERFDLATGNPTLGPELARHAELRMIWQGMPSVTLGTPEDPAPRVRLEAAPYTRKTVGSSRNCVTQEQCPDGEVGRLTALGETFFYGIDLLGRLRLTRVIEIGGSYGYVKACELGSRAGCDVGPMEMGGADPIDRLPRHRADAWLSLALGRVSGVVRGRYFGSSLDRQVTTEAYSLVEANLTTQLAKAYMAVLRVDDALDRRPETRAGFYGPGRVISVVLQGTWE
jgi:outer membrane receptor protein involved in Fe transport